MVKLWQMEGGQKQMLHKVDEYIWNTKFFKKPLGTETEAS